MFEPRGHDIMSGAIIYPAHREDCDVAAPFVEVSGCLPMCGAGAIGLSAVVIEEGLVSPRTPGRMSIEVPPGRVDVDYTLEGGRVTFVRRFNVPRFLHGTSLRVDVSGLGPLLVDIAYGGNLPSIGGWARITGHNTILVDEDDPLDHGFQIV